MLPTNPRYRRILVADESALSKGDRVDYPLATQSHVCQDDSVIKQLGSTSLACCMILVAIACEARCAEPNEKIDRLGDPLPQFAIARLGTNRLRHAGGVTQLKFSDDGRKIASQAEGKLYVWDAESGKRLRIVTLDGLTIIDSGSDQWLVAKSFHAPLHRWHYLESDPPVEPDKDNDFAMVTFPVATIEAGPPQPRHANLTLSPDGRLVASVLYVHKKDPQLLLRRLQPGAPAADLPDVDRSFRLPRAVERLKFSADGRWIVAVGKKFGKDSKCLISICDSTRDPDVKTIEVALPAQANTKALAISDGCDRVGVVTSSNELHVYSLPDGKQVVHLRLPQKRKREPETCLAISPDNRYVAASGRAKTVYLVDLDAERVKHQLVGHGSWVERLAFAPDSKKLASAGQGGVIYLWDVAAGTRVAADAVSHSGWVFGGALNSDGKIAATCGTEKKVHLWDATDGRPLRTIDATSRWLTSCRFSNDGHTLAVSSEKQVMRYDATTGRTLWSENHVSGLGSVSDSITYSASGQRLASPSGANRVSIWEPAGRGKILDVSPVALLPLAADAKEAKRDEHKREVQAACLAPDGKTLAVSTRSRMAASTVVELWDVDQQIQTGLIIPEKGSADVLRFSPDGSLLLTAGYSTANGWVDNNRNIASAKFEDSVILWDVETLEPVRKYATSLTESLGVRKVGGAAFSADGAYLLTGERSGHLCLYRIATGELAVIDAHLSEVNSVNVSGDGARIITVSQDMTGLIWDFDAMIRGAKFVSP